MTVLFADLSGYTAFAEGMDPEQVKSQVDRALFRLGHEVERYGGTVDKYIGDNVMALFGAPVAHEDDAERAVRAGLGMQDAMEEINAGLPSGAHFELRVGVNTGEVLAGAVGETYTVVGDTVNVASRLQSAARPGSVTVGERTMRATDAAVRYETLEPLTLKGKAEPVPAWEAVGLIAEHSVRRVAPARESPLVGRQQELATLDSLYERVVREGTSHLVTVVGEAGVGKSRAAARVRGAPRAAPVRAHRAHRPLPPLRERHRVLGARRGAARGVRDRRVGFLRGGLGQAALLRRRADGRARQDLGPRGRAHRPAARRGRAARARAGGGRPRAHARVLPRRPARRHRGDREQAPVRDRLRGHPLGRRRHARRHRAPRAVGARAADAGLPGARRAARPARRAGAAAGAPPRSCSSTRSATSTAARSCARCCRTATRWCRRWPSAPAATRCSPRRWPAGSRRRAASRRPSSRTPCRRCWRRGSTRSTRSSAGSCSRPRWWGERSPRGRSRRWRESEGRDLGRALMSLQEKDILAPSPAGRCSASASSRSSTC